jgi:hypothetical protein
MRDVQSYLPDQLPFDYTRLYVTLPKVNFCRLNLFINCRHFSSIILRFTSATTSSFLSRMDASTSKKVFMDAKFNWSSETST